MRIQRHWFALALLPLMTILAAVGCDEIPAEPATAADPDVNADEPDVYLPDTESRSFEGSLQDLADDGDQVFMGEVLRVEYRMSQPRSGDLPGLPHTFVTFAARECYSACEPGDEITLRFVGGLDDRGMVMMASGLPLFDVGDTDLLFVKDNGLSACPLAGCANGRLRIIGDVVFSDDGREILLLPDGTIRRGEQHDLHAVHSNRIGEHEFSVAAGRGESLREVGDGYLSDEAVFVDGLMGQLGAVAFPHSEFLETPTTRIDPDVPFTLE